MISETLKTTVSSLQAAIHGLSTARHLVPEPITATPQTQLIPKLRSAPSAAALDRDDYPDVPFWDELTWSAHEKSRNNVKQLDYLTDEDGQVVGEGRLKEMSSYVRALFNQLLDAGKDPMSWRKHSDEAARYVYSNMLKKYSEFRYCDSDWKIRIFVMIRYREWSVGSGIASDEQGTIQEKEDSWY
ncbi:hypothetical protein F5050DRAFT_1821863 [Lentinula boryana]|uniref:Uncharacterized protein n=1 Tax=Lentinula boryana TaxID=40481 RepID=A0ABQ8PW15_9AGAR|nr:hypothetical protein F5050DRAFT_1821863 [Lentinula boryana]